MLVAVLGRAGVTEGRRLPRSACCIDAAGSPPPWAAALHSARVDHALGPPTRVRSGWFH